MATRTLTRDFVKLRALSRKRRVPKRTDDGFEDHDDHASLLKNDETRIEMTQIARAPAWERDKLDFQNSMVEIRQKIEDLKVLHNKHATEVGFDDNAEEEMRIEIATKEITEIFLKNQGIISKMGRRAEAAKNAQPTQEQRMAKNVQQAMAVELQDLSSMFRKVQASYLKRMKTREDRSRQHDLFGDIEPAGPADEGQDYETGWNEEQQQALQQNTVEIQEREKAIIDIVKSIEQLNTIFRELAILIVDQGTIIDRIDYNLETAVHHIDEGNKELDGAEKYQKSAGKKIIIIFLVIAVIGMIIGLIVYSKSKK